MADELGSAIEAVVIGNSLTDDETIGQCGINDVTHIKNSDLENYST